MPREQKKRGRRLQAKPYTKDEEKVENYNENQASELVGEVEDDIDTAQQPFYGLLEDTQVEYFKEVEGIIAANVFSSPEEEEQLYEALWLEVKDIELKVATDPTGSKALERLLHKASQTRLLELYKVFTGRFAELSTQRFASHCLETLLNCSRSFISSEVEHTPEMADTPGIDTMKAPISSAVVDLFMEIKPDILRVAFNPYGSHVIRTMIIMLAGKPLPKQRTSSVLSSKKSMNPQADAETLHYLQYTPPAVFRQCVEDIVNTLTQNLSMEEARRLALNPVCSPVLQLLIELEDDMMQDNLIRVIFPSRKEEMDFLTTSFMENLLSSPIGSHFLEKILYSSPLSFVEYLYSTFFTPRLSIISKAKGFSFVARSLMERLKDKATSQFGTELLKGVNDLTLQNVVLLNNIILAVSSHEGSQERVAQKIIELCAEKDNMLLVLLDLKSFEEISPRRRSHLNDSLKQRCILVESIVAHIPKLSDTIVENFVAFPADAKIQFSENAIFSHVAEVILARPGIALVSRRKILNDLMGHFGEMACSASASRIVDACKVTTNGLMHYKERIAQELVSNREVIQRNPYGRNVWRNWSMDQYVRSSYDWKAKARQSA